MVKFSTQQLFPNEQVKRAIVILAIEKSLLRGDKAELEFVAKKLYDEYRCYFADCYDHPEYLKAALSSVNRSIYYEMVDSIKQDLAELMDQKEVSDFVEKLN